MLPNTNTINTTVNTKRGPATPDERRTTHSRYTRRTTEAEQSREGKLQLSRLHCNQTAQQQQLHNTPAADALRPVPLDEKRTTYSRSPRRTTEAVLRTERTAQLSRPTAA